MDSRLRSFLNTVSIFNNATSGFIHSLKKRIEGEIDVMDLDTNYYDICYG